MTGSLMRVPGNGNLLGPEACQRSIAGVRRPHALRPASSPSSAWSRSRPRRATRARRWSARSISCRSPATSRPRRDQVPGRAARHGGLARADRRHPRAGAVPGRRSRRRSGIGVMQATQFVTVAQPHAARSDRPEDAIAAALGPARAQSHAIHRLSTARPVHLTFARDAVSPRVNGWRRLCGRSGASTTRCCASDRHEPDIAENEAQTAAESADSAAIRSRLVPQRLSQADRLSWRRIVIQKGVPAR